MKKAIELALDCLSRRAYTRRELEQRLVAKGVVRAEIEQAVARVQEWGYLDDRRYALAYCEAHRERYSRRRVAEQLRGRGVDREIIALSLAEAYPIEDEYRTCLLAARRIWPELLKQAAKGQLTGANFTAQGTEPAQSLKQKAGRKLAQRGFSVPMIKAVLEEIDSQD